MSELPADRFFDFGEITGLAVGPHGERIAFVLDEFDPEEDERRRSLFVVPTDGSREPHRLTRASDAGAPRWSPDGSKLGFVTARDEDVELTVGRRDDETDAEKPDESTADENGDTGTGGEGPRPQLWVFDMERGGDARQITGRDGGVENFDWGPDGDRVVIESRDPTETQAEYLRERRDENGRSRSTASSTRRTAARRRCCSPLANTTGAVRQPRPNSSTFP